MSELTKIVKVTSADFNGKTFDGSPFDLIGESYDTEWIEQALVSGELRIGTPGDTDYALFGIKSEHDESIIIWAGPGDYLKFEDGKVVVIKAADWKGL